MTGWIHRVSSLFGGRHGAALAAAPLLQPPAAARVVRPRGRQPGASTGIEPATRTFAVPRTFVTPMPAEPLEAAAVDLQLPFIEWLLDAGATLDMPPRKPEEYLLGRVDAVLASDRSRSELLPRARAVIPQLLNTLRDESRSVDALAERVAKDPHLLAEVLQLANSAWACAEAPVQDLAEAIQRVGTHGLRRVIASVVLKPMFDAQVDALSARAAPRLWLHSEATAAECMRLAEAAGADPFEGYLAGLMHNIGWTALLRAIDRSGGKPAMPFSRGFVEALAPRREMFFALLLTHWQLTDSLSALAAEMLDVGLHATGSPLGHALRAADRHASMQMLGVAAEHEQAPAPVESIEPVSVEIAAEETATAEAA